jgi:hypothetical protein
MRALIARAYSWGALGVRPLFLYAGTARSRVLLSSWTADPKIECPFELGLWVRGSVPSVSPDKRKPLNEPFREGAPFR